MIKSVAFKVKGMQRDLSVSAFNPEYAYENKNIRIMPTNESTLLSIINEKGNITKTIAGIGNYIVGTPIGQAVIDDELVLFTAGDKSYLETNINSEKLEIDDIVVNESSENLDLEIEDKIYKLKFNNNTLSGERLFSGDLNFNYKYPIETLSFYENSDIKKVYWTDGLNQPRVINIAANSTTKSKWNNNSFDFVQKLKLQESITITKNIVASGNFASGVIQYAFTYFNKYGQESNIFDISPLYYIAYNDRGASPESKVGTSFNITVNNVDTSFDYLRIYSIQRTSINATPIVHKVVDLAISEGVINYTDTGLYGDSIDPTELLYIGGEEVIFGTLNQKDNTLFFGDIQIKRKILDSTIRSYFYNNDGIAFQTVDKRIDPPALNGYYSYKSQLYLNSRQIKTFKYLEHYRFGIQAQHYTGKWSEPIWINDVRNKEHIDTTFYDSRSIGLPIAYFTIDNKDIIDRLISQGYVRVRPVVVYPTINEREAVCQGVLCPTVFNVSDRYSNTPFVQSSWFVRPNAPFDYSHSLNNSEYNKIGGIGYSIYSKGAVMHNGRFNLTDGTNTYDVDTVNKGAWAEFRHNYAIPDNSAKNAEIQCIHLPPEHPRISSSVVNINDINEWVVKYGENFYVDQSIVTLHSPDIEFDDELRGIDSSKLKLRIVGMVPITSFISDIDIQTSTTVNNFYDSTELPRGFYKEPIGVENDIYGDSYYGWKGLISGAFWFDELTGYKEDTGNTNHYTTAFVVYPWHRNGSLNNTRYATDGYRSAMLSKKRLSNLRYSYKTQYLDPAYLWYAYLPEDPNERTGISGVSIFDSNEVSNIRIPSPLNSGLPDLNYYGNVDKLVTYYIYKNDLYEEKGYPIMTTGVLDADKQGNAHKLFTGDYLQIDGKYTKQTTGTDPVRIKYKSSPHAVIALNYNKEGTQRILPTIKDWTPGYPTTDIWTVNYSGYDLPGFWFWDKSRKYAKTNQDVWDTGIYGPAATGGLQYGWLWLGELYNDEVQNRFGGQTEEAFENNQWMPCGKSMSLLNTDGSIKSSVTIYWTEGDTYYQRYDHIKTYPFTSEDQNQVTDIVSFMCETRVNIDGRYDRNRGQLSNLAITPQNFNLLNKVYSQQNNFFNYRSINPNKLNVNSFNNTITWTKTKTVGEIVDTWTNITLASTLDLDGDKGPIRSIKRWNNNLIAFQDKGISQILYNESMQISSNEGVPIEIANSSKVNGKRYITNKLGCTNKWSICETPNGIYFIDDITKGIFLFNGQLNNISDKLGFHSWINAASKNINIWNPVDFDGFVTYYDKVNGDVFFVSKDECLGFSEPLGQFTSFYSYEKTQLFANLQDRGIWVRDGKLWLHNEGDYNMFFGTYKPFYTTIIANPDMQADKVFNNLEFRADSWDKNGNLLNTTFDTLTTWNEYQKGTATLTNTPGKPSTLKKKFRIWRANIPRDKVNSRDRMRNPWLYVKLSMERNNTDKTILHDIMVHYIE